MAAYLLFTLESLAETKPDWRWQLTASGRFAHRKEYVVSVGEAHQLQTVHYESLDGFRHEHGKAVRGHMFVMQKKDKDRRNEL
jgi:predicted TPR repeat methyltransferase